MMAKSLFYAALIVAAWYFEARFQKRYLSSLTEILHGSLCVILLLELLAFSGQFLGGEYAGGTLPNLILTPHSLGRIVLSKFWGGLLTLMPTLGAIGVTSIILRGHDAVLLGRGPRDLALVAGFVLLLHLTTFYSIRVRRGAVAWAVATLVLAAVFVMPLLEMVRLSLLGVAARNSYPGETSDGPRVLGAAHLYLGPLLPGAPDRHRSSGPPRRR